ncbi:DUF2987 domain-containing protein [Psychromonas sp. KJ10-10]|uniref:DUF2987 domain-containing protein n=1 Tax=Psychromonas sp. KJ10-10 TaxID=3391823 RepID=UPI0039B48BE5
MRILILFLTLIFSQNLLASTLKLNYSLFFGYMKTMYKLDYQHVTTGFYLVEESSGDACLIDQAEMVVDQKREAIDFEKQGKLLPFIPTNHRKDGAMIEVKTVDNVACALQVRLTAKESELSKLSFQRLTTISTELEGVLRKNAGMIGKYFLPNYNGLRFKVDSPLATEIALQKGFTLADNGDILVSNKILMETEGSELLPFDVNRVSPWIGE